ncbi:MAG: hypothetical protein WCD89_23470 [Anaerocolumna sp.]
MEHYLIRATIIPEVISLIMKEYPMTQEMALETFYSSETGALLAQDESGLYGQSPLYIYGLFKSEFEETDMFRSIQ